MSTIRAAADILATCRSARALDSIASQFGFSAATPLDANTARALGLDPGVRRTAVSAGRGALRAVRFECGGATATRELVARVAARLAAESPQLLWLVLALGATRDEVVIAAPAPGGDRRVAALVVDRRRVTESDAETVVALIAAAQGVDLLVHQRWREVLGREALTKRFYRELERAVGDLAATARGAAREHTRRELALLCTSRLLFLAFLEAKGWLDGDREFLRRRFDACCLAGGGVHQRLLNPLFFGTLNTPLSKRAARARALGRVPFLNGGLFARTPAERGARDLRFTDEALGHVIGGVLGKFRVTAHEHATAWSEAAVDPEMLGRAFESLMAAPERQTSGAFYTPPALIERVVNAGMEASLVAAGVEEQVVRDALQRGVVPRRSRAPFLRALEAMRVCDPACGSGAFLVHALDRIAGLMELAGDTRGTGDRRRDVLTRAIFGVDINPTAVWLCELRLWLSVVLDTPDDHPLAVAPLPNLDRHIRVGDSLSGDAFAATLLGDRVHGAVLPPISVTTTSAVARLRGRYSRATGTRKRTLARALDREERLAAVAHASARVEALARRRRDLISAIRARDLFSTRSAPTAEQRRALEAWRTESREARRQLRALRAGGSLPFSFDTHFGDIAAQGGFTLIMTNPPWVRLHNIPAPARDALRARFRSYRDAAWLSGVIGTGATRGFGSQVDLAALFVERAISLVRARGVVALLTPTKLWSALAGGGVRQVVAREATVLRVEDWSEAESTFDAVVYPSLVVAQRRAGEVPTESGTVQLSAAVRRRDQSLEWQMPANTLALDASPGAPWLLLPSDVRRAFDALARVGEPLVTSSVGRPLLGVKTGCNEAFLVSAHDSPNPQLPTRPVLRGEQVREWGTVAGTDRIVWTHDAAGAPLRALSDPLRAHLGPWRRRLEARTDARGTTAWWSLFRTESARDDVARVVWSDIGKSPRAAVLPAGDHTVPLNSCYVARAATLDDAFALAALLNSSVAAAWLAALAETARGGYHRYLGWTMARLPVPHDWLAARARLAPVGRAAHDGRPPDAHTLTELVLRAYGVRHREIAPLLVWCLRS